MKRRNSTDPKDNGQGRKEHLRELSWILGIFFVTVIATSITFRDESLITSLKLMAGLFWMFLIPGFMILYRWKETLSLLERIVISVPVSAGLFGLLSYLTGIFGMPVWNQPILLPAIIGIVGIAWWFYFPVQQEDS